jgi:hypothetical protein
VLQKPPQPWKVFFYGLRDFSFYQSCLSNMQWSLGTKRTHSGHLSLSKGHVLKLSAFKHGPRLSSFDNIHNCKEEAGGSLSLPW